MSTLYLVATPIGNLEDITYRAVRVLGEVPVIAAEDTRKTGKLLKHYGISAPLTSYHDHNKAQKRDEILARLGEGDVALVSDAGTPGINDPGFGLVNAALGAGHTIIPLPGASAPITALSASGLPADSFLYLGYLPRKSHQRQKLLNEVKASPHTLIFLATPHRLLDSLQDMASVLGNRKIAVARELTKRYEEIFRGTIDEAQKHFTEHEPRGEFTLVVAGLDSAGGKWSKARLQETLREAQSVGKKSPSKIAKEIAKQSGWKRSEVYDLLQEIGDEVMG